MPQVEARLKQEFRRASCSVETRIKIVAKGAALIGYKYQIDEEIERLMTPEWPGSSLEIVASATGMTPRPSPY